MTLVNERTGDLLADSVEVAGTRGTRRRGLLGRDGLPQGTALMLTPCNAIHTVGMRFTIDAVFLDRDGTVRRIVRDLRPWRMAACFSARMTVEFEAGYVRDEDVRIGDRLRLT